MGLSPQTIKTKLTASTVDASVSSGVPRPGPLAGLGGVREPTLEGFLSGRARHVAVGVDPSVLSQFSSKLFEVVEISKRHGKTVTMKATRAVPAFQGQRLGKIEITVETESAAKRPELNGMGTIRFL